MAPQPRKGKGVSPPRDEQSVITVYTADVFTTEFPTADVFTADAAGPKERKLWTPTVGRHNYADEQRRLLWNMQAMFADEF
jgi:hypothetical protein